jgi:hypothetical protein
MHLSASKTFNERGKAQFRPYPVNLIYIPQPKIRVCEVHVMCMCRQEVYLL